MQLIKHVKLANFRSIESISIEAGELTAFIGTNGSGKSNVVRALNLFFNGAVEGGVALDLRRDFHKPWRSTRNRYVEVEVGFTLPPVFSIKKRLRDSLNGIGISDGSSFSISKKWERDPLREGLLSESLWIRPQGSAVARMLSPDDVKAAVRFLQLIRFRYIPNHVHPSELLQSESAALQEALIVALKTKRARQKGEKAEFDAVLGDMADAAKDLVAPITKTLAASPGHIEGLELATPGDWAEVIWSLVLRMQATDARPLEVGLHGSGNQTFLMYLLISFLDTRFGQRFGWHQATIWAIEEPESFLHADLENELASFLMQACRGPRFQAFITTHELLFAATADASHEVRLGAGETVIEHLPVLELADRTLSSGVSHFVHPLNLTPPKPTLLVDGPYDAFYLEEAYRRAGRTNPWDTRSLEQLDPRAASGGKDAIRKYLRQNEGPLRARPRTSPVVVLLDWEASEDERRGIDELVSVHSESTAIVWPIDQVNPQLGETFRGSERYLSGDLVESAAHSIASSGIVRDVATGVFELQPQHKSRAKRAIIDACRVRGELEDLRLVLALLPWLEQRIPRAEAQAHLPGL